MPAKTPRPTCLTEAQEQKALAIWLNMRKHLWCHVPNGGSRSSMTGSLLKAMGVKPGVPDVLIFTPPPNDPTCRGVAIEMKRVARADVTVDQGMWHRDLRKCGWHVEVTKGAKAAIAFLEGLGY